MSKTASQAPLKLLVDGWRGIHHSFAMVNQHQLLALLRRDDVEVFHHDMPMMMQHWNSQNHNPGFSDSDYQRILDLQSIKEEEADCVLRICAPMFPPNPQARRTLTFGVTELGFSPRSLNNPQQVLGEITAGENLIVTPTRWSRDRLIDFGFNEAKVRVLTHGVDLHTFAPLSDADLRAQRKALQLSEEAVVFLNIGVPTWNKGIDLLIRAFARVHRQYPNTRLILKDARGLYGLPIDSVLQSVQQNHPDLIDTSVLSAISVIPGNLSQLQMRLLYATADWYVSPYRAEGFNLPVLEAQACGTPVITSSGGATDDFCNSPAVLKIASVFKRGQLGQEGESCWVDPDMQALESLMLNAASEGARPGFTTDALRQAARTNADHYSWDRVADDLMNLIRE